MKMFKRALCVMMAVLLVALSVTGCSAPKLTIGGTPDTAAKVGDVTISTGEYLAYLYESFYNLYYSQGLYQYEQYGTDVWTQKFPYGEGDDAEELELADYIRRMAQDSILRQIAIQQLLDENELTWDAEEEKAIDEDLEKNLTADAYLPIGVSNENYIKMYKTTSLGESSLFYGLYGEGGKKEMGKDDRRAYYDKNMLSYKMMSKEMLDSNGAELKEADQKEITTLLDGYLDLYKRTGSFEKVVDEANAKAAAEGEEITPSTDKDNRRNNDATQMDEELVKVIRDIPVGQAKVVTYKAGGSTLTAALILRLDINEPATLFDEMTEQIIYGAKFEEFDKEVQKRVDTLHAEWDKKVMKKCDPRNFLG